MLITEYIQAFDRYIVIPTIDGKPDPEMEFVFDTEDEQREFIQAWFKGPMAAIFAYQVRELYAKELEYSYV